uniref:Disintegrin and metalloproteinase domain-containing protein 33-like n=1 Tax=Salarias fasciatus TaxID=181472 RepID=A0A672GK21_SALFA
AIDGQMELRSSRQQLWAVGTFLGLPPGAFWTTAYLFGEKQQSVLLLQYRPRPCILIQYIKILSETYWTGTDGGGGGGGGGNRHPESWIALSTCAGLRYSSFYHLGKTHGPPALFKVCLIFIHPQFKRQNRDYEKTRTRIMEIANYVDKFYRNLNIRVPLIGLEVWTDRDQCIISEEPNATLWSFLQWRQKLKSRKKHDNAQLLTGVIFKGTTIGMAPLEGMCSLENSGGINVDHSELPVGAAATMAHEIGHNLGMSHDHDGCCVEATAEQGGCVMAAATGHPFPRVFSRCSQRDLDSYFQKGGGMCLYNMPNMKDLVGGKRCGNGFVEDGEECDCGEPDECTNDCCHSSNCTLKEDAQCAHGVCCEGCRLKQAGTMCRGPAGTCDLPEYCTGASPYCPANVYLLDGSSCQSGLAYCHNGMCLTHQQQCLQLWGYGARPAHDACFQDVNAAGNAFGNCGKDEHGNYMKCDKSDAKCGKIQCLSAAKKPKGTNAVSIDTTIRTDGVEVKCRGTYVYSTHEDQGDLPDPGLVMTGTKCGEGKVCRDRRCQNASFTELETCITRCHGNGVCNSNGNCHCNRGWAPPFCEKPGLGGSVDSGPVQYDRISTPTSGRASLMSRGRLGTLSPSGPCSPPPLSKQPVGAVVVRSPVPVVAATPEPGGGDRRQAQLTGTCRPSELQPEWRQNQGQGLFRKPWKRTTVSLDEFWQTVQVLRRGKQVSTNTVYSC